MRAGAEMIDRLAGDLLRLDPFVEVDDRRDNVQSRSHFMSQMFIFDIGFIFPHAPLRVCGAVCRAVTPAQPPAQDVAERPATDEPVISMVRSCRPARACEPAGRDDDRVGELRCQQRVERARLGLLERRHRFVEQQHGRAMRSARARSATRCCSPPDSTVLHSASSSRRPARWPSPAAAMASRNCRSSASSASSG